MRGGLDLAALQKAANGHSIFAPSASAMWLACPGSLVANLLAPDRAGEDAARGTVAHAVAEQWLSSGERPTHWLGNIVKIEERDQTFPITIDREMLGYVEEYVNWCNEAPGDHFVETRVDFSRLTPIPAQGGTADHLALAPGKLILTDLKYGTGVQVFAKENPQVQLYALGSIYEYDWAYDFQEVVIRICQPRLGHFDEWVTTKTDLLAFGEHVKERAALAWQPAAPRTPGPKQCRFCNARPTCPAIAVLMDEIVDEAFEGLSDVPADLLVVRAPTVAPPVPAQLSTAQMALLLPYRKLFETWFREIAEELERRAGDGEVVPGFKLVTGRSSRQWTDENDAALWLDDIGDELFERKMISPHGAEKAMRRFGYTTKEAKAILSGLVTVKPGRQTLVPEADLREGELNLADASFDALDEL